MTRFVLLLVLAAIAYGQPVTGSGVAGGGGGGGTGDAGLLGPVTITAGTDTVTLTHNLGLTAPYTLPGLTCERVKTISVSQIVDAANTATVTATAHGLSTNDRATIAGVTGDADANGTYKITVTGPDTFTFTSANVTDATYNNVGITAAVTIKVEPANYSGSTANTLVINLSANAESDVQCVAAVGAVGATGAAATGDDTAYDATSWNANTDVPTKNVVRDKVETLAPLADPVFTGSVQIPNGTGPTVNAAGEVAVDTTSDQLQFYGAAKRAIPTLLDKSFVINAPVDTDDFLLMKAPYGMTVVAIKGVLTGSTNVVGQIQECDSSGASCVDLDSDITFNGGEDADDGSLTDSTIASGNWIAWKTTSVSGTPTSLTVTITFRVVAD